MSIICELRTIERYLNLIAVEVGREHRKAIVRDTIFELLWRHRVSGDKQQDRWTEACTVLTAVGDSKRRERGRLTNFPFPARASPVAQAASGARY